MAQTGEADAHGWFKRLAIAAFWLGFAFSGFFDGILLHKVLQWHHLLSGLGSQGQPSFDLGVQIAVDGYFHVLMYLIAVFALWLLWRARHAFEYVGASRAVLTWLLIGFGIWHIVDAVASHWVTQIHRIRMDADNPLLWDIGWLVLFGALPLAVGLALRRPADARAGRRQGAIFLSMLALVTACAAIWSAQRPPGQVFTAIVFGPGVSFDQGFVLAKDMGEVAWFDGDGVFIVKNARKSGWRLFERGAVFVSGAGSPPSCVGWTAI